MNIHEGKGYHILPNKQTYERLISSQSSGTVSLLWMHFMN